MKAKHEINGVCSVKGSWRRNCRTIVQSVSRRSCAICGCNDFDDVVRFHGFPTFMGTVDAPSESDFYAEMRWVACKQCETVQLQTLPQIDLVYPRRHTEAVGATWADHDREFSRFVARYRASAEGIVSIDRLGTSGQQLSHPSLHLEPTRDFVHSHMMEHWRDPSTVIQSISRRQEPGSRVIFSVPAMDVQLANGLIHTLNFEHSFHLSQLGVEVLMQGAGYYLVGTRQCADHSVFFAYERDDRAGGYEGPTRTGSLALVRNALDVQDREITEIRQKIREFDGPVYLFGAHIFSQYLLKLGIEEGRISGILDNSRAKQGQRLYGTRLVVSNPIDLNPAVTVLIVVRTGPYDAEIREGIKHILGSGACFC